MSKEEKNIDLLVVSYLDKTLSETEQQQLEEQLAEDSSFKSDFLKDVETYRSYRQLKASEAVDTEAAWKITKSKFTTPFEPARKAKNKKLHFRSFYRIAAAAVVLLGLSYLLKTYVIGSKSLDNLEIPNEEITLVLPNGDVQQLNLQSNKNVTTKDGLIIGRQSGAKAQFNQTSADGESEQFATLKIPFGKKFNITLSDGTEVYLNAGTTIKFPQNFIASAPLREVEVEGEAYFEVAKNARQPFVVHTSKIDVKVIGTHFNVRTYPEEKSSEVVLAEGSVKLKNGTQEIVLKPGDMGYITSENKALKSKEVFVSNYISWINGDLIYRNVTFEMILKSIERHFNVKIENHSNVLKDERLNINFGNDPLPKVLSYLHDDYGIDYTIKNNTIILK